MKDLILKIHDSGKQAVIAITGGGTEAIGELLRHGNGSKTLLEAVIPYHRTSFDDFVRGIPDKYCSEGAARDLAMASYQRALKLTGDNDFEKYIGIGATSTLVKDNERSNRDHVVFIAAQTASTTSTFVFYLNGNEFTREQEETIVAQSIIYILANAIGLEDGPFSLDYLFSFSQSKQNLVKNVVLGIEKCHSDEAKPISPFIFPGSFNPLHEQHANIANVICKLYGEKIDLELCVHNVDKPALNYHEINNRLAQIKNNNYEWLNNIHFTSTPTFAEKSKLFPKASFIIGYDTLARINDPKYGNLNAVVEIFKQNQTQFHVFHRIINGKSSADNMIPIYPPLLELCKIYDKSVIPPVEISSTAIRKRISS